MLQPIHRPLGAGGAALAALLALLGSPALGQNRPGTNPGGYYIGNAGGINRGGSTGVYVGGYPSGYQRTDGSGYYVGGNVAGSSTPSDLSSRPENFVPPYYGPYPQGPVNGVPARRMPNTSAVFHLRVPADAEVRFDGQKTQRTGTTREFITPPLRPWTPYSYRIWVHWMDKGKPVDQFKQVTFYAGDDVKLDFRQP